MSLFGSAGDGGAAAAEAARQKRIREGMVGLDQSFAQFDEPFYQQAATDYTQAVTPKLMSDYRTTRNNLTYALARGGLTNSSAAVQRNTSLQNNLARNESQVANNAQQQSNALRSNVNSQKSQLVAQLESSADPTAVNSQAQAAVSQLRAPSAIQPLGNLFADWSQMYLNNQSAQPSSNAASIWSQLGNNGYGSVNGNGGASYLVN